MLATFLGIGRGNFNIILLAIMFPKQVKRSSIKFYFYRLFLSTCFSYYTVFSNGFDFIDPYILLMVIFAGISGGLFGRR